MALPDLTALTTKEPDWFLVDPARQPHPLTGEQSDRAGGVLLGMAVVDGWSRATELALCVADAASTGRSLTEPLVLDLLRRNLRERQPARDEGHHGPVTPDDLLATTAVVALAHIHDGAQERADATAAVAQLLDPAFVRDDALVVWAEIIAETVRDGTIPSAADPGSGAIAKAVRAALDVGRAAETADPSGATAFLPQAGADSPTPAGAGALLGARFGWGTVPDGLAGSVSGWPGADAQALVGLGLLAARLQRRSVELARTDAELSGGAVLVEDWGDLVPEEALTKTVGSTGSTVWRRSPVVLTPSHAEEPKK